MLKLQSVKVRLTLWYALVLSVFLAIFSFMMYAELARALYHDAEKNLAWSVQKVDEALQTKLKKQTKLLQSLTRSPQESLKPFPPETEKIIKEVILEWERQELFLARSQHTLRVVDLSRQDIVSNLKEWEKEIIFPNFERDSYFMESGASYQTIHFKNKPFRLYYKMLRVGGYPVAVIQSAYALHETEKTLKQLGSMIAIGIPLAVLCACFAGWFLARRFFKPVDSMTREAKQITAAHLDSRLPRTYMGDEIDRLAETLNEMIDRLEHSTRAMREFSSDVSHELKTPLAIIRGELDLASRKTRSREEIDKMLLVISEETDEMIRLVNDLMILVRSDARQLRLDKQHLHLLEVLEPLVDRFQERSRQKGIRLIWNPSGNAVIEADEGHFKRVMNNLVDNALKFTDSGGEVTVSASTQNEMVIIEVKDSGIGITSENQPKIFMRFFRDEKARSREGSGLGLSIVKAICDAHAWQIGLESIPGQGTLIRIFIPASEVGAESE
ncbi:MAG TPA: ATP-binding protein [Candidatus Omnitrophota bacterium]|nr:hypothetical protein [Candidatus Omnitrophota bacterium]HRK61122.1 ATP-binding protein [Candidatus Omnitrophota bacterium]